jgi:hypothetical protein
MTKKEVTRKALNLLSAELGAFNFKLNLKEQGFIRKHDNAVYLFHFLIYPHFNLKKGTTGFIIEPYVNISIPLIERYFKEIMLNTFYKTQWHPITIGNSIAELRANPDGIHRKWDQRLDLFVAEEHDLQTSASELCRHFKQVALPYFLANNTLAKIDELLNKDPLELTVHMSDDLFRFVKGIIAAKLNNNPRLDELVSIYSQLIIDWNMPENCRIEMDRLKELLPEITMDVKIKDHLLSQLG